MNYFIVGVRHKKIIILLYSIFLQFIFAAVEMVEATSSYYEKVSEELEKIVNEVKNSPTEENKTFTDSLQPTHSDASKYSHSPRL